MVSFHTPLSPSSAKIHQESEPFSKKRKWDDPQIEISEKLEKFKAVKSIHDYVQHDETRLPLEWQQCLDIKSGQLYFYNIRTHKRAFNDPRTLLISPEPSNHSTGHMISLDLELNLPCGSLENNYDIKKEDETFMKQNSPNDEVGPRFGPGLSRSPSWLTFDQGEQQEMITAVCKKCYMLVMMYKSSPACPNCKFMQPLRG